MWRLLNAQRMFVIADLLMLPIAPIAPIAPTATHRQTPVARLPANAAMASHDWPAVGEDRD